MAGALLYQPSSRWRFGVALSAAALIHLAAVALANIHRQERINEVSSTEGITEIIFDPISPTDDSTPPQDPVAPTPSEDVTDKSFVDENPSPPPIPRHDNRPAVPIAKARNGSSSGSVTLSSAKIIALSAPRPEYPYEARRQKITGSGIVAMTVDPATGRVTEVSMWQSTGSTYLDNAAITGFRKWRFKPGTALRIKSPITYTLTGAGY